MIHHIGLILAEEMGDDEVAVVIVALIGAIATAIRLALQVLPASTLGARRWTRTAVLLTPVAALIVLYFVLAVWSAADVRTDGRYIALFMLVGCCALGVTLLLEPLLGISLRLDVVEASNPAAAIATSGAMLGAILAFAGSNVGEGPTIWTTIGPAAIALGSFFALWLLVELASRVSEAITVERDVASGWRLAGLLAANGLLLGRAMAGNWESFDSTLHDFAHQAWFALVLSVAAAIAQRVLRPTRSIPRPAVFATGVIPAAVMVAVAVLRVIYLGSWS
jgi:uncharacterized membrane protein YjfL (UPF0719 family)